MRKSKREKEKEAAEAKRKEEEANAAKLYAEFLDSFEGEDVGRRKSGSGFVKAGQDTAYNPIPSSSSRGREPPRAPRVFEEEEAVSYCMLPYNNLLSIAFSPLPLLRPSLEPKESVLWTLSLKRSRGKFPQL